jgi:hypothetical protein
MRECKTEGAENESRAKRRCPSCSLRIRRNVLGVADCRLSAGALYR